MKSRSTIIAALGIFLFFNPAKIMAQEVSFFIVAHADDWQLFMGTSARGDVTSGAKVIFVTLTAGDAGWGGGGDGLIPYYRARENGCIKSAQFIADIDQRGEQVSQSSIKLNGHKLRRYAYKNTVNYFLRLPDGNIDGSGFGGVNAGQSLEKLRTGAITQIAAVDGSSIYTSWNDLVNTLKAIINQEKGTDPEVWINIPSTDPGFNPGDHSDHYNTSDAAQQAVSSLSWVGITTWVGYHSANLPTNLTTEQIEEEAAMFACSVIAITEGNYPSHWLPGYKVWFDKDYFGVLRYPSSSARIIDGSINKDDNSSMSTPDSSAYNASRHFMTEKKEISVTDEKIKTLAMPNPSKTNFKIVIGASSNDLKESVKLIVTDMMGRVIETRTATAGQIITVGDRYRSGTYLVRIIQGKEIQQLKLVKLPD